MPIWLSFVLILTHVILFSAGAVAYHLIRVLSVRPIGPFPTKPQVSEAKLNEIAMKAAKLSAQADRFGTQFEPMPDMTIRRQFIPDGDGRSKEETFAPVK